MRAFLIKFCFYAVLAVLCYCLLKFVVPFFSPFVAAFLIAFILKTPTDRLSKAMKVPRTPVAVVLLILFYAIGWAAFSRGWIPKQWRYWRRQGRISLSRWAAL